MNLPKARSRQVVVQTLGAETLIYDLDTHQAFNLNETLSVVYNYCDGATTFAELRSKHNLTDELIRFALDELQTHNLLDGESFTPFAGTTRREVIRKVGLATLAALPVIAVLSAPAAAAAASNEPTTCNTACTCSVPNSDPELSRLCAVGLDGTPTGCTTQVAGCDCFVAPNSSAGQCVVIFA